VSVIRVLLVDDNDYFLSGATEWLDTDAEIELVGTAVTAREALDLAERLTPDVVLIDESLSDMKIVDVTRRIKALENAPRVVVLTFHNGETARQVKTATGADDVVAKSRVTERLLPVIRDVSGARPRHPRTKSKRPEITRSEP